ncbi:MAG TPA: glycosyltransferase family 4 protein [Candidatus Cybelea sp.]|nr:glycosyltransferase family 4 protein [Candidatus Cybelea sp.]
MNILFVHQNMPGQFGHLAAHLARNPENHVVFLTKADKPPPAGVRRLRYRTKRGAGNETHHYIRGFENAVLHGQAVAEACIAMARGGFAPDLVVAHPGWGEALYIKDALPNAKLVSYCEFFYRANGADVGYGETTAPDVEVAARVRTKNAALILTLEACDRGLCPTEWQRSVHPREWQNKIDVVFDGIDAERVRPDPAAAFRLANGTVLRRGKPVVTYVARNLEPYRGFPNFVRAIPSILDQVPDAQVVIVGGNDVSYGARPADGRTWRAVMEEEVNFDQDRVHFTGLLPYAEYLKLLQVSAAHVYLTVPFVLSWSMMEALAAGCVVIGSRTPPVEEMIRHGENGLLADFRSPHDIAARTVDGLRRGADLEDMRRQARATIVGRYDLSTSLPAQVDFLRQVTGRTLSGGAASGHVPAHRSAAE